MTFISKIEPKELRKQLEEDISLCPLCYCMTYTIKGVCGKCGSYKEEARKDGKEAKKDGKYKSA